jgi:hypothetical protein
VQFIRITAIITVALAGHVNSEYYHIRILSHLNSFILELEYFLVAFAGHGNLQ